MDILQAEPSITNSIILHQVEACGVKHDRGSLVTADPCHWGAKPLRHMAITFSAIDISTIDLPNYGGEIISKVTPTDGALVFSR